MDTVCNTFGGVLFIALLIALQVRHTVEQQAPGIPSTERIAELLQQAEALALEIESKTILLETIRRTLPKPVGESEIQLVAQYSELLDKRNDVVARKSERTHNLLTYTSENAELIRNLQEIDKILKERQVEEAQQIQIVQSLQNSRKTFEDTLREQKRTDSQDAIALLEAEIERLKQQIQGKTNVQTRVEKLFLPKMEYSDKPAFYLMLRYNRLYIVHVSVNRSDFDYRGNEVGIPKRDRGFAVNNPEVVKQQLRSIIRSQSLFPTTHEIGILVYGDSAGSFHIVRDAIKEEGFRYVLRPSKDDYPWSFGGGGGGGGGQ